jgi:hypothetical protein
MRWGIILDLSIQSNSKLEVGTCSPFATKSRNDAPQRILWQIQVGPNLPSTFPGKSELQGDIVARFRFIAVVPALLASFLAVANAQVSREETTVRAARMITSVTATVKSTDLATGRVTVSVSNDSGKDVTAYAIDFTATYADGHETVGGEFLHDCGSTDSKKGNCFHPGHADECEHYSAPQAGGSPLVRVDVRVGAVVFADLTSEVAIEDAYTRIRSHRSATALALKKEVEALETVLAVPNEEHPGTKGASVLRALLSGSIDANGFIEGMDQAYLKQSADELGKAKEHAAIDGITETEYLSRRLASVQRLAADEARYAEIRRPR